MNTDRIEALLERYDNAATTREEEQELMHFFLTEEVPAHLQADKAYFLSLKQNRLSALIDRLEAEEKPRTVRLNRWQWVSGIAAGVLILLAVGFHFRKEQAPPPVLTDTCATPEEAYQHTKEALMLFSTALNKGLDRMAVIPQTTAKVQTSINEQFTQLNN